MFFRGWKETAATVWSVDKMARIGRRARSVVIFNYRVDRRYYRGQIVTFRRFTVGQKFTVRYDPRDPRRNNVAIRYIVFRRSMFVVISVLSLIAVGLAIYYMPGNAPPAR